MSKWVVVVGMRTSKDFDYDIYEVEYSGIYHHNRDDARQEFLEAKYETEPDPYVDSVYIQEVFS